MTERDPANPTPEELREQAASEGLMATEEETDPDFVDDTNPPADVAEPADEEAPPTGQPPVGGG
jgi:hypothetical protein